MVPPVIHASRSAKKGKAAKKGAKGPEEPSVADVLKNRKEYAFHAH